MCALIYRAARGKPFGFPLKITAFRSAFARETRELLQVVLRRQKLRHQHRAACRACADSYTALAAATGQRSMRLRAALLRIGLPAYQAFLKHKT